MFPKAPPEMGSGLDFGVQGLASVCGRGRRGGGSFYMFFATFLSHFVVLMLCGLPPLAADLLIFTMNLHGHVRNGSGHRRWAGGRPASLYCFLQCFCNVVSVNTVWRNILSCMISVFFTMNLSLWL